MIQVDKEFENLCPQLTDDEYSLLEASILEDGCRDALTVWPTEGNEILIDGHNRKRICDEYEIEYDTVEFYFQDRGEAMDWILRNQLGRRNLHPDAASLMRGRLYNRQKKAQGGDRGNQYTEPSYQNDNLAGRTVDRLANELGVSAPTISRDGQFADAVEALSPFVPDIAQRAMSGDLPSRKLVIEAAKEPEKATHQLISQSKSNEWYTPNDYVEAARRVMGNIDLDPASNDIAQGWIKADTYYTEQTDGLSHDWNTRVWLNPPWGRLTGDFVAKLAGEMAAGRVQQAVVLVNAHATDTKWFVPL